MPDLGSLSLVDVVIVVAVLLAVVGALRRGRLVSAVGSALGTVLVAWLAVAAIVAWGPRDLARDVRASEFAQVLPVPQRALQQLEGLGAPSRVGDARG